MSLVARQTGRIGTSRVAVAARILGVIALGGLLAVDSGAGAPAQRPTSVSVPPSTVAPALASVPVPVKDRLEAVQVVRSDAGGVEFTFEPGALERVPDPDPSGAGERLRFPRLESAGVSITGGPGEPEVPVTSRRVLIPAGAGWRLRFSIDGEETVAGLQLPRRPLNGVRRDARRPLEIPALSSAPALPEGEWPEAPVMAAEEELRGQRVVIVTMAPFQYDPGRRTARVFHRLRVQVDFTPGGVAEARAARSTLQPAGHDGTLAAALRQVVLNPAAAGLARPAGERPAEGRLAPRSLAPGIPAEYFGTTGEWVKIRVRRNGLYRVTGQSLQAAGVNLAGVDPATLRVFSGAGLMLIEQRLVTNTADWGQPGGFGEVTSQVDAGADGHFDAADGLIFYGLAVDNFASWFDVSQPDDWLENDFTDSSVYWVTWGQGFAAAPRRMAELSAAPQSGAFETAAVDELRHFETNSGSLYDPLPLERGVRWERWWWQRIDDTSPGTYWDLSLPDVDAARPARLFARWWGSNIPGAAPGNDTFGGTHFLNVTVNGGAATNAHWQGITRYDFTIPTFTPSPTTRVVATIPSFPNAPDRIDQILLAWFEVTYSRRLNLPSTGADKGRLWITGPRSGGEATQFRVTGSGATDPGVYDVTDPRAVVRLTGAVSQPETAGRSLAFRVADTTGRRWLVSAADGYLAPESVERDTRPTKWLRDPSNAADYIIVAYDDFMPAAEELAAWRRQHLRGITDGAAGRPANVVAVRVSDVYDEFSGGVVDATAIRNFIQYAFVAWNGGGTAAPPSYLVLMGDANRDTRDREQTGVRNLIPTWENGYDTGLAAQAESPQFSSDDFFVRLSGPTDRFADLRVGRIPAVTPGMALQIVRGKVIHAEAPDRANSLRDRAVLTADDICQAGHDDALGYTHQTQSEDVDRSIPGVIDRRKIYLIDYGLDCSILFKPEAKRDLLTTMNEGAWLINFIGHGSDQQIYDEKILEVPDVATLSNLDALPLLIAASCSVGKFDRANSEGLAEALIKGAAGGCLAAMAGTHLTYSSDNSELNIKLMNKLFQDQDGHSIDMGTALWQSKLEVTAATPCGFDSSACDRQRKFVLLGDPGSPTVLPSRQVVFTAAPDSLRRGAIVTVSGEIRTADRAGVDETFNGTVELRAEDHPEVRNPNAFYNYTLPGARLFEGVAPVTNGRFNVRFVVPVSLRGGSHGRLRAYVASTQTPVVEGIGSVAPLPVGGSVQGTPDVLPPQISITLPAGRVQPGQPLQIAVTDSSGINLTGLFDFRSLLLTIEDEAGRERFRSDLTESFAYDAGSYTSGKALASFPTLGAGRYVVRVSATDNFNNRGEGTLAVEVGGGGGLAVQDLFNHPNPFTETTRIYFTSTEAGSARVTVYSVSGRKVWQAGLDAVAGQNDVDWDGRDGEGDAVANGVYLVRVQVKSGASGRTTDSVERMVRVR